MAVLSAPAGLAVVGAGLAPGVAVVVLAADERCVAAELPAADDEPDALLLALDDDGVLVEDDAFVTVEGDEVALDAVELPESEPHALTVAARIVTLTTAVMLRVIFMNPPHALLSP